MYVVLETLFETTCLFHNNYSLKHPRQMFVNKMFIASNICDGERMHGYYKWLQDDSLIYSFLW